MKTLSLVLSALGLIGAIAFLIPPRVPIMPPGDGGSETLESFPVLSVSNGGSGVNPNAKPVPIKTRLAPYGVNTITKNENGTGTMTLAWVPKSAETAMARVPHHVITQAEAEEVVRALSIATRQAEPVQFGVTHAVYLTPAAQAQETANRLAREEAELSEAKATLAKWRKRVEEGKP